ncbi:hypothetical protein E2562_024933 [Oryza meyeriana var. granulata]|uniref:Uncharacterized protein n=1 Tax=Oryza meyeriana var. granulata TaxID=110450 RepID=A0A6G1DN86_9ORYZ|nr:hypothetical protein E2562_024933 [Oryza meyeriana var. granulata]
MEQKQLTRSNQLSRKPPRGTRTKWSSPCASSTTYAFLPLAGAALDPRRRRRAFSLAPLTLHGGLALLASAAMGTTREYIIGRRLGRGGSMRSAVPWPSGSTRPLSATLPQPCLHQQPDTAASKFKAHVP